MKLKKKEKIAVSEKPRILKKKDTPKFTDLSEVIDRTRDFSMMYSGVEDSNNFKILYDMGIRNFLVSFHYVQKKHLKISQYEGLGIKFFVDSGAYTFMNSLDHKDFTLEDWEKYIQQYLRWAEKNREYIFAIANLDLEFIVDSEIVQRWNEKYFEPFMLRTGIPVCFVHHDEATKMTWEQYCQRYPYVGVSYGDRGADLAYGLDKLRTAEKYGAVVHGMAMTQTALLTKLPFYTVDSTTWLVGLQYGEINYWTGQKMSRLKKEKWKGPMLQNLTAKGFDEEKLLEEDTEEMIKVNVHAFVEAEEFIQHHLKSGMYWQKAKAEKRSAEDLADFDFPDAEWCEHARSQPDLEEVCQSLNISTENLDDASVNATDMTVFLHWEDEEYQDFRDKTYTEEIISQMHDMWVNKIAASLEEKIAQLQQFYLDCWTGENTTLLYLGTNFDRVIKEREEYVEEEETETIEVSRQEMTGMLSSFLPAPGEATEERDEISELDDEIFKSQGIVPIRDEKGRLMKGSKNIRKDKKLYSEKYPQYACDWCMNAQKCPEYKPGFVCAYKKMFKRFKSRDMNDVIDGMQGLADYSMERLQMAMLNERMNGGIPDPAVSQLMNQSMQFLQQMERMHELKNQEIIRQTKVLRMDGTQETTTQVSNPQSGGFLERLFMEDRLNDRNRKDEEIIEGEIIDAEIIEEEKKNDKGREE